MTDFNKIYKISFAISKKILKRTEIAEEIAQETALFIWEYKQKNGREPKRSIKYCTIDIIRERFGRTGTKRALFGEDRTFVEFRETGDEQGPATIFASPPTGHAVDFEELRTAFDEHSRHFDFKSSQRLNIIMQWNLEQSAELLGVSITRVNQYKKNLINKIKKDMLLSQLNEFIEEGRTELSIKWI